MQKLLQLSRILKVFKFFFIVFITGLAYLVIWVIHWQSPCPNVSFNYNIHNCIHKDYSQKYFKLWTQLGKIFDIYLVANSRSNCLNPFFPSIHITTNGEHNAWVHIVYTDSKVPKLKNFIDAGDQNNKYSFYPFYTYNQDFYDAPLWSYTLLSKPISFWKGHAFAVKVNHKDKNIFNVGAVEWGFELSKFKLRPVAIYPKLLDESHWEQAWVILKENLPEYKSQNYPKNL